MLKATNNMSQMKKMKTNLYYGGQGQLKNDHRTVLLQELSALLAFHDNPIPGNNESDNLAAACNDLLCLSLSEQVTIDTSNAKRSKNAQLTVLTQYHTL